MRGRLRKLLSFVLVLVLVVQMLPVSAFAEGVILAEGSAPTLAQRPDPRDSIYYRGPTDEYEADDVLWEIESERTETEKHFPPGQWLQHSRRILIPRTLPGRKG